MNAFIRSCGKLERKQPFHAGLCGACFVRVCKFSKKFEPCCRLSIINIGHTNTTIIWRHARLASSNAYSKQRSSKGQSNRMKIRLSRPKSRGWFRKRWIEKQRRQNPRPLYLKFEQPTCSSTHTLCVSFDLPTSPCKGEVA